MDWYLCKQYFSWLRDEDIKDFLKLCVNKAQECVKLDDVRYYNYYPQEKPGIQLVIEAKKRDGNFEVDNLMFHHIGWNDKQIWEMVYNDDLAEFDNICFFGFANGNGGGIVRLVNREVLGSLEKGQIFRAQVCGVALDVNIFEDENGCSEFLRENGGENTVFLEDGLMAPLNFLANHTAKTGRHKSEIDYSNDNIMMIKGKIMECYTFDGDFDRTEGPKYYGVRVTIENAGELLVIMNVALLQRNEIGQLAKGNVILAEVLLSGDPCVEEYAKYLEKRGE